MTKKQTDNKFLWNIFKEEVVEAAGCTETACVGFACSKAIYFIESEVGLQAKPHKIIVTLDPATKKNGNSVGIAGTNEAGFYMAAALGVVCGEHSKGLLALEKVDEASLLKAKNLIEQGKVTIKEDYANKSLKIEINIRTNIGTVILKIENTHTNITYVKVNRKIIKNLATNKKGLNDSSQSLYRKILMEKNIYDLVELAENSDKTILDFIEKGIKTNLLLSEAGLHRSKTAKSLSKMIDAGICSRDPITEIKIKVAAAVEGRMTGVSEPAMSSGGSGNQGNMAILVPYLMGKYMKIDEDKIKKSIVLSHLINSYVKCYTGALSSMCGCSISAGLGAAAAIAFQNDSKNIKKIEAAINNAISSTVGLLCEGGNEGCAAKMVIAVDGVIRSAMGAIHDCNIYSNIIEKNSAKQSIINMSIIASAEKEGIDRQINKITKNIIKGGKKHKI